MTNRYTAALLGAALMLFANAAVADSDVPNSCLHFKGIWSGKWKQGRATAITVTNIKAEGEADSENCSADVRYAWGALGESKLVREAGSLDVKGSIEGNYLYVPLSKYNAKARFTRGDSDTVLNGIWSKQGYGSPLSGTFAKQ